MTERPLFLYRAFIAHCDADKAVGALLARSLRSYRVGAPLVGQETHAGKISTRLGPIFTRPADESLRPLSGEVVHALFGSQFLIVIVSRHCPSSEQVNKEIRLFKHYHGESRILYVVIGDGSEKCFPAAALFHVDADGALTDREAHPGHIVEAHSGIGTLTPHVAAYLLGVSLDAVETAQERRRRAINIKWSISAGMLLLLALGLRGIVERSGAPMDLDQASTESDTKASVALAPGPLKLPNSLPFFASSPALSRAWPMVPSTFGGKGLASTTFARGVSDWRPVDRISTRRASPAKKS